MSARHFRNPVALLGRSCENRGKSQTPRCPSVFRGPESTCTSTL